MRNVRYLIIAVVLLSALIFFAPAVQARQMIVRVDVPDYPTLYQHIPFKGTSVEIAGAQPGKS
ncbi:MAG: hypothetical protein ABIK51_03255, partial [candidate division WOR-3 bacterium]